MCLKYEAACYPSPGGNYFHNILEVLVQRLDMKFLAHKLLKYLKFL